MSSSLSSDIESNDSDDETLGDLLMVRYLIANQRLLVGKNPCRTSILSGKDYIFEVLLGNPTRCYDSFRMKPHVFKNLCDKLKMKNLLVDAKEVSVEEGVAMALAILCHGKRQRIVAERFQHSIATVHFWFKTVIRALVTLGIDLIKPRNRGDVQPEIQHNSNWFPYFKNCIGAIDGTHVSAWAPATKSNTFRGRKSSLVTQNVMAVCSHDMIFTFIYTGWDGTANDSRIFLEALTRNDNNFPMPMGDYYYAVDVGYPNIPGFLAPYRGERYHLKDFRGRGRIRRKYELFDFRHSSLRNVIERAFGVLKARFIILKSIPGYPLRRQKLIPVACCTLHNFIREKDRADYIFTEYSREGLEFDEEHNSSVVQEGVQIEMCQQSQMHTVRESIANHLWNAYNNRQ